MYYCVLKIINTYYYMNDLSISIIIDQGLKKNSSNNKKAAMLKEKKLHYWVDDAACIMCSKCNKNFTLTIRKHHCRNCGKVFCYKCSDYQINIPNTIDVPIQNRYLNYTYFSGTDKQRVCVDCYDDVREINNLNEIIEFFYLLPITITEYVNISLVCATWNKIANNYFNKYHSLHYKFPDYVFNARQKNILYLNRFHFSGHSKWITQLIISFDWKFSDIKDKLKLLTILDLTKSHTCSSLLCTRNCSEKLMIEDIIMILSRKIIFKPLIQKLLVILKNIIIKDDKFLEISCYLYAIINFLHFYKNYTCISTTIQNFLLYLSVRNTNIANQLFWLLTQFIENPDSGFYFRSFRLKLVNQLDEKIYKLFQNGYDFTQNIIKIANKDPTNAVINLKKYLHDYAILDKEFTLPIDVLKEISYIDYNKIRDVDSKTKPIILPCIDKGGETYNIMLKNEDIRKEAIIMNIIKLINLFLINEEGLDLNIISYNILPISSKYGYIEFVPNSKTLYHIKEDLNFSIQNWIIENNPDISIAEFRENICRSCAAYCIITYLLGIGDRHLDNIMITKDGILFHIDFGFILGQDPKLMSPEIRLTPEIIDAMGGIHSKYYKNFKNYCNKAFCCIRRHCRIFYILLLDLTKIYPQPPNFTKEYIKDYIFNRFRPGGTKQYALQQIEDKIDFHSAKNSYAETIIDYFHKKNKLSSTNSSENSNVFDKVAEYGAKTKKSLFGSISNWFY